jgi:hypothetical protein
MSSLAFPDAVPAERTRAVTSTAAVPWYVWTALFGVFSGVVGAHWDISWHRTIGRDAFWTAPHIAIYLKGVLAGITFGYLILQTTFTRRDATDVVSIWGLKGPLGAFIAAWGGVMMLTSGPFDNWWHDAYGLDVKIVSPPHIILLLGAHAVTFGTIVLVQALRARGNDEQRRALLRPLLLLGGFTLIELMILQMEYARQTLQHSAFFYRTMVIAVPATLCIFWTTSGHRWACTIVASIYSAFLLLLTWGLPLFPAEPKLGPVYMHLTHFVPNGFPLLFIAPAIAMDLVLQRIGGWNRWLIALIVGPLFLAVFFVAQWPFASFMMSPAARNAFFGAHYFSYFTQPTSYGATYRFFSMETTTAAFWTTMAVALVIAPLSSRVGLGIGQWLLRIKR